MNSSRPVIERSIPTWDGSPLFYRAWLSPTAATKALILFHRGHEHSGRWQQVVDELALDDGVAVFAWDARGHGRSGGERGTAESVAALVKDAEAFASHISNTYGISRQNTIVMGHSVGAVIAAAWVHDYAPPLRGLILATPAFRVKLYVPGAVPLLRLRQWMFGEGFVKSYVKAKLLTHDAAEADAYNRDPLIFRQIAVNMLLDLHDTSTRLLADAGAIQTPTLIMMAGRDWIVRQDAQRQFFAGLSSPVKRMQMLPGFFHAIFHERDRRVPIAAARAFIVERFAADARAISSTEPVMNHTKAEHERLRSGGPGWYLPVRWALKTIGRLSDGVRLGWRTGFDSGLTLDYVYENRSRGITPVGRLIDRAFLGSIGWRGIRQRRVHVQRMLHDAIDRVHAADQPAHLLDIAAGPGRYVLEAVRSSERPVTALLQDAREENVEAARELSARLGVSGIAFARGDAFDATHIARTRPRPTVAVVSGLYELFPDNAPVSASLRGLADALEPGGYLVYTNQPWHPQLEFIARTLTNREGHPWVMRRRTQAEMDQLVREAGFRKVSMEIDRWGIFTVSLAQRVAA